MSGRTEVESSLRHILGIEPERHRTLNHLGPLKIPDFQHDIIVSRKEIFIPWFLIDPSSSCAQLLLLLLLSRNHRDIEKHPLHTMLSSTSSRAVSTALFKNCAHPPPSQFQLSSTSSRSMQPATRLFSSATAAAAAAAATRPRFSASSSSVARLSRIQQVQRFSSSPARRFSPTAAAMGVAMINK